MQHGKTVGARSWPPAVQITDALAVRHFRLAVEETDLTRLVKQLEFLGLDAWTTKFGASSAALRWSNRIRLSPRSKPGSTVHSTSRPGRWNSLQEDVAGLIPTIIHFSVSFYLPLLIRFFPHAIRFFCFLPVPFSILSLVALFIRACLTDSLWLSGSARPTCLKINSAQRSFLPVHPQNSNCGSPRTRTRVRPGLLWCLKSPCYSQVPASPARHILHYAVRTSILPSDRLFSPGLWAAPACRRSAG
jgi:hypothetical protein